MLHDVYLNVQSELSRVVIGYFHLKILCYTLQLDVIYKYNFYDDDNFRVFNEQHGDLLFEGHF